MDRLIDTSHEVGEEGLRNGLLQIDSIRKSKLSWLLRNLQQLKLPQGLDRKLRLLRVAKERENHGESHAQGLVIEFHW